MADLTIGKLVGAYQNAKKDSNDKAARYFRAQLRARVSRDRLSRAFYAALAKGDKKKARNISDIFRASGLHAGPRNESERKALTQRAAKKTANNLDEITLGVPGVDALQFTFDAPTGAAQFTAGVGEGANNFFSGVKQNLIDQPLDWITGGNRVQQDAASMQNNEAANAALNNTTPGMIGNITGNVAASSPLFLIPGAGVARGVGTAGKIGLLAGEGGLYGAIAPHTSRGQQLENTLLGAAIGPAVHGLGSVARSAASPARAAASRLRGNFRKVADQTLGDIRGAREPFPGENPILTDVSTSPEAVRETRRIQNMNPEDMARRQNANNDALAQMMLRHRITNRDEVVAQARAKLQAAIEPHADTPVDPSAIRKQLASAGRSANELVKKAAKYVKQAADDKVLEDAGIQLPEAGSHVSPSEFRKLMTQIGQKSDADPWESLTVNDWNDIRMNVNRKVLSDASQSSTSGAEAARKARGAIKDLRGVESTIRQSIDDSAPGYAKALDQFRKDMEPVNTSDVITHTLRHKLEGVGANSSGETTLNANDAFRVKEALQRHPLGVSKQAIADADKARAALRSAQKINQHIGAAGSSTLPGIMNAMKSAGGSHYFMSLPFAGFVAGERLAGLPGAIGGGLAGYAATVPAVLRRQAIQRGEARAVMNPNELSRILEGGQSLFDRALTGVSAASPLVAGAITQSDVDQYRASHPNIVPGTSDQDIMTLLQYQQSNPDQNELSIPIYNGTAVPASENNP